MRRLMGLLMVWPLLMGLLPALPGAAVTGAPDLTIQATNPVILPPGDPVQAPGNPELSPGNPVVAPGNPLAAPLYNWQRAQATVTPSGDLVWAPQPFVFHADAQARYIDFAVGNDANDGSRTHPWQHHPWDANATGNAAACTGVHTFIFKGGVTYRGSLIAKDSGAPGAPIRLTRDPAWGTGAAVMSGAQALHGGWKHGDAASAPGIPDPEKCWYQDIGTAFVPRALWAANAAGGSVRIPIARTPHWQVTDPNDPRTGWNVWSGVVRLPTGEMKDGQPVLGRDGKPLTQTWVIDENNLTQPDPAYYVGATLWSEYIGMMGTPYPQVISKYDPARHALLVQDCWGGSGSPGYFTYAPVKACRYYLENLPQFLDAPGEYFFAEKGLNAGRLFLRLPGDADPNTVTIEAARELNLIDIHNQSHIDVSGLTFRFENVWRWQDRWYENFNVNPACVRILGSCADIRVANCLFDHVAEAVRTTATDPKDVIDDIEICDNDIAETDHGGITTTSPRADGVLPLRVRVLRNRLLDIGPRPVRGEHSVAIEVGAARALEVAGNIIDRAYGSGFLIEGGWAEGKGPGEIPGLRMFVHHNKVTNCLLHTCDWGAFDVWRAGGFVYDNIVGNPVGEWNPPYANGTRNDQGFAFYTNGPLSHGYNFFNNVAWGRSNDTSDPTFNYAAFFPNNANHVLVNNTADRFEIGMQDGNATSLAVLGNLFVDMRAACQIGLAPAATSAQRQAKLSPDALSNNVFIGKMDAVLKLNGRAGMPTVEEARAFVAAGTPVAGQIGTAFAEAPAFRDAEHTDFRLAANSPAVGAGVKYFFPFPLNSTVGEWKCHATPATPSAIRDGHFQMNDEWPLSKTNDDQVRHDLAWQGDAPMKFVAGPLEDWIDSALSLDGKNGYCAIHQQDLQQDITEAKIGKVLLAGANRRTPDMRDNNFLIEAYFRTVPGQVGGIIVAKGHGYVLDLDQTGTPRLALQGAEGQGSRTAAATVNDGHWHHVIAEADRANAQGIHLYVDGVLRDGAWTGAMPKASLSNTDDLVVGKGLSGALAFLRLSQGTLRDADTTINELYAWEFNGPFLRDFMGVQPAGKRDAGAFQH